jgi:hypothetical protein
MKNSTLVRIKVPKALYESALRKALLEASDKEPKGGHSGKKYAKEDDYSKPAKKVNPAGKHSDKEPKNHGFGPGKQKTYTKKVSAKKSLGETKKKVKEATEIEKFRTLTPNREIYKDANRMQEKKGKIKENVAQDALNWVSQNKELVAGLAAFGGTFASLSVARLYDIWKKAKQNVGGGKVTAKDMAKANKELPIKAINVLSGDSVEERKHKMEERKKKMHEKHDDTAEDTKLIKKLVKPSALKGKK